MPPVFAIRQGDCLELFSKIKDQSVNLILTDLPYGTTQNSWDSVLPLPKLWEQFERILKPNSAIVLTTAQPFSALVVNSNIKWFKYEWIWEKEAGTGFLNAKKQPLRSHESILVFYRQQPTYNPQMEQGVPYIQKKGSGTTNYLPDSSTEIVTINEGVRYPKTVLRFQRDRTKFHPTQKPVALMEYLIRTYSNSNDIVLDPCMGSGTTGVACKNLNRRFIGFELDTEYFAIANRRINE